MRTRSSTDESFAAEVSRFNRQVENLRESKKESDKLVDKIQQMISEAKKEQS
jgi:hypothetical protein